MAAIQLGTVMLAATKGLVIHVIRMNISIAEVECILMAIMDMVDMEVEEEIICSTLVNPMAMRVEWNRIRLGVGCD